MHNIIIEDLISYWFLWVADSCIICCFYNSGSLAVLQLFLRKHLMVSSESTECQNTINCSLNDYTVKCCGTLICGKQQLGQLCCYRNFFNPRDICSLTNHGPDLWLNMVMFCILIQCCPIYTASMPSRHYISTIMQLKKCCNFGPDL